MIWIIGNGFRETGINADLFQGSPYLIQFRNGNQFYNCINSYEPITSSSMSCYTPPLPAGQYDVFVYVDGDSLPRNTFWAIFYAYPPYTPTINSITPSLGTPQRVITLTGDFKISCYSQESEACWEEQTARISRFVQNFTLFCELRVAHCFRVYIGTAACNLINPETNDL